MLAILSITTPIFLLIALGYLAVRVGIIPKSAIGGMAAFAVNLALPALLFKALSARPVLDLINPYYLIAFGVGSLLVLAVGLVVALRMRAAPLDQAAFQALGGSLSNSAFVGLGIVSPIFGTLAVTGVALSMLVDLILLIPVTVALAEWAGQKEGSAREAFLNALYRTFTNPLVLAIFTGMFASWLQWLPPKPVMTAVNMLAGTAAPLSLFVIGGMLVGISVRGQRVDLGQMVLFKLALHPVVVALIVWWLPPFDPILQACVIVLASMPMAGVLPMIAQRYGQEQLSAAALVTATALSFFSINLVLWLLGEQGMLPAGLS